MIAYFVSALIVSCRFLHRQSLPIRCVRDIRKICWYTLRFNDFQFLVNLQVKLTSTIGLSSETWWTVLSDSSMLIFCVNTCSKEPLPYIIGGDFNMPCLEDKNKDNFDPRWPNLFNMVIQSLDLWDIEMSGRRCTWASSGDYPNFEKVR